MGRLLVVTQWHAGVKARFGRRVVCAGCSASRFGAYKIPFLTYSGLVPVCGGGRGGGLVSCWCFITRVSSIVFHTRDDAPLEDASGGDHDGLGDGPMSRLSCSGPARLKLPKRPGWRHWWQLAWGSCERQRLLSWWRGSRLAARLPVRDTSSLWISSWTQLL